MMTILILATLAAYEPTVEQARGGGYRPPTPYRPSPGIPGGGAGSGDWLGWLMPRFMWSLLVGSWIAFAAGAAAVFGFRARDDGALAAYVFTGIPAAIACALILGLSEGTPAPVEWVYNHGFLSIGLFLLSLIGGAIYVERVGVRNKKAS